MVTFTSARDVMVLSQYWTKHGYIVFNVINKITYRCRCFRLRRPSTSYSLSVVGSSSLRYQNNLTNFTCHRSTRILSAKQQDNARAISPVRSTMPALSVGSCIRYFSTTCEFASKKNCSNGAASYDDADTEDCLIEDSEVDQLFQHQIPTGIGEGYHRVFIVHPDVKWGCKKQALTTAELQMDEAVGLVNTLENWTVVDKIILSTKTPEKKRLFGKGNFQILTERIKRMSDITAVFVNVERLSALSERELEEAWGVKVLDRYTVVLHIFRCNARTKEAKLQISLAEIPLLRSRLRNELANLDQQSGGSRYIMGSGETMMEVQQRILRERELKIRSALEKLSKKRHLLRSHRQQRQFPTVSIMGYTNCGKTTLIKALTGDAGLEPRDQLFATLDVTVHAGQLPCHMTVLFVDTIGFLSQLPHQLIDSFSATLEDVSHSDLIIHVRDVRHPETVNQKANVLNILKSLQIPDRLLNSILEVHNKIDLIPGYQPSELDALPVSALTGQGLEDLKQRIEAAILESTGKLILSLMVPLNSSQLSWLYKNATVQEVTVEAAEDVASVRVIISTAAYGRYKKHFQVTA